MFNLLHILAWSGLSLGALAGLALLVYLNPAMLKWAIGFAALVILAYVCVMHGNAVGNASGRAAVQAQWDAARKAEIAAALERDAMTEQQLEAKYAPQLAELQSQINAESKGPDNAVANAVSDGCKLGARASRVRH
jgi:hypothetical protein